jgi:hypothetical protein
MWNDITRLPKITAHDCKAAPTIARMSGQGARQYFTYHDLTLHVADKCRCGILTPMCAIQLAIK